MLYNGRHGKSEKVGCWWWITSRSGWLLELLTELTMLNGKSYILYKTKLHPGPFKLHCKTTRNKGQTLDEVVSRTVVGEEKKLEICRLSFQF